MSSRSGHQSAARVAAVRRFNRFYTRQIGVLQEGLLRSPFSLTDLRVLYEVAHREKATAGDLCRELGLDAGYLSRILVGFEKRKLVSRTRSTQDGRQSFLSLTGKGRGVFRPLERRSNRQVSGMLRELSPDGQAQLVGAMHVIEKLLKNETAPKAYVLRPHQPGDMGWVVHRHGVLYAQEWGYDERFEALVAKIVAEFVQKFDAKRERCWVAERDGEILGTVFLVKKSKTVCKLRLLLVEPTARGMGIGRRLVAECVRFGQRAGYKKMVLWTQSELDAARHLYKAAGFRIVGRQRHNSWGRRGMVAEIWEKKLKEVRS